MNQNTKLCWLEKIMDGFVFREDFEADQFVLNDGWLTLQGIASHTKAQSVAGLFSLLLKGTQDDSGLPIVLQLDPSQSNLGDWQFVCWFYDDATETSVEGPFLKLKLVDGKYIQVGPRNGTSTTFYSCNPTNITTNETFQATSVARSTGWHRFMVVIEPVTKVYQIYIDTTLVRTLSYATRSPIQSFYLQGAVVGNAVNSFGYFDEVRYQISSLAYFEDVEGRRIHIPGVGTTDKTLSQSLFTFAPSVNPTPNDYAVQVSQKITSASDTDTYKRLAVYFTKGDLRRDVNGGDQFFLHEVDFERRATTFQHNPGTLGNASLTTSARSETITTGRLDRVPFAVNSLSGSKWVKTSTNFWQYARQGQPFGFMLYANDAVYTTLTADAPAGTTGMYVDSTLNVTAAMVQNGQYIMVESADRTKFQMIKVINQGGSQLVLEEALAYDFVVGDVVRSVYMWPSMELDVPRVNGFSIVDPRSPRYNWVINMRERVNT